MSDSSEVNNHDHVDDSMDDDYAYDEANAAKADDVANALTEGGPYIGRITSAVATASDRTGTKGVVIKFDAPGQGHTEFTLWTVKADTEKTKLQGMSQLDAIQFLMGIKQGLKASPAKVEQWQDVGGKREKVTVEGKEYKALYEKPVGFVLQKELYTKNGGGTGERMNLLGVYSAESKLTMTEIKERKTEPVKYGRLCKMAAKPKDSRKAAVAETEQPGMGVPTDGY